MIRDKIKMTEQEIEEAKKRKLKHKSEYQTNFIKGSYKRYEIRYRKDTEAHIINFLDNLDNVNAYIKSLILADIENKK